MIERGGGEQGGRSTAVSGHEQRPMLARSAEGLYWMGRYLERAAHLCRLLRLQTQALVDRPEREIGAGWRRIYRTMNRVPPVGRDRGHGRRLHPRRLVHPRGRPHLRAVQSRRGVELFRHGARERAADAPLHQCRDVDPPQPGLPAHSEARHQRHLAEVAGGLLRADRRRDRHLRRRGGVHDVPRRRLGVPAARAGNRTCTVDHRVAAVPTRRGWRPCGGHGGGVDDGAAHSTTRRRRTIACTG